MDLTEAEDIKKRQQEYTKEVYKNDLNDPDNHNGVITHVEPEILECEAKWALGSITTNKASGGDKWIQGIRSDRVSEELWMEVCNIVQEAVIKTKTIPKKKKCKKAKWLSEGALQIAEKTREANGKGKKDICCTHLNAEFQRIARRDKKAFLSDQCKEIEENNRMGKTRDLFKKIRDTKGILHAKLDSIKDRNGMDLTEAEDIKKRWQEYTEEL